MSPLGGGKHFDWDPLFFTPDKTTYRLAHVMSAFGGKADIVRVAADVAF
jgi:hypothetical protein